MTALWAEGFEATRTKAAIDRRYTNTVGATYAFPAGANFGTAFGKDGGTGATDGSIRTPTFAADDEIVVGLRFLGNEPQAVGPLIAFFDAGTEALALTWEPGVIDVKNFILKLKRGAAVLNTSQELNKDTYYFIEMKAKIDDTTGSYELKINEVTEFSDTGVDTDDTGNSNCDAIQFEWDLNSGTSRAIFDDIYILNTLGSAPDNNFLGDSRIEGLLPDGDGNDSDWTPSSGVDNYLMVDELDVSDDDTTYVTTSSSGQTDLYTFANMQNATGGTIFFIMVSAMMRLAASGSRTMRIVTRNASTTVNGGTQTVANDSAYEEYIQIWEQDPVGASAWTETILNASEFGVDSVT